MNTRILRMIDRSPIDTPNGPWRHPVWCVGGIGQMQPVTFAIEHSEVTMRIEGIGERHGHIRPCWWRLPLPYCKAQAKQLFGELEHCRRERCQSPAALVWSIYQAEQATLAAPPKPKQPLARVVPRHIPEAPLRQTSLFG